MRLFFYYITHTGKNSLIKLFKSWVLAFVIVCVLGGMLIGLLAASLAPSDPAGADVPGQETVLPAGEAVYDVVELIAGVLVLALFVWFLLAAEKGGGRIFKQADVNLLFPSPLKPQTVLMFRLLLQMGAIMLGSLYLVAQISNIRKAGIPAGGALLLIFGFLISLAVAQLLKVLFYLLCSNHPGSAAHLRRGIYLVLALIVGGYILYFRSGTLGWWQALLSYMNAPLTRYIPFWGWLKAFMRYGASLTVPAMLLYFGLVLAGSALLAFVIWHMKADFYEDAMGWAEQVAEAQEERNARGTAANVKRGKERSERIRRNELSHGWGANVFFYKAVYNRSRFAHLGFATPAMELFLLAALLTGAVCRFVVGTENMLPFAAVMTLAVFFRTLGNPLKSDTGLGSFVLIPASTFSKLGWSLLGGLTCCLLDLALPFFTGLLLLGGELSGLLWLPAVLSVYAYGTTVGAFIDISTPKNTGKTMNQMAQVLFIYFGLIPDIAAAGLLIPLGLSWLAPLLITLVNGGISFLFLYFTSLVMGK